ncbi:MAG TPA: hypothetical protein VE973_02490 [Candidatus Limnocylindria bacterium]|nr:hypothetical protein [Candidatus Limnocylindria bacterium]
MDWQTFGHKKAKNILDKQLASGKLPHAYLFTGPSGIGKKTLALEFAKKLLESQSLENHPDFHILDAQGEITMDLARSFTVQLGYKPFLAQKKVAIINNAENLNQGSSNALLKTLEEPNSSAIIILISGSGRLLPTIVSRCQVLNFNSFNEAVLREFAKEINFAITSEVLNASFGSTAKLKNMAENKRYAAEQLEIIDNYKEISKLPLAEKFVKINSLADTELPELKNNLTSWMFWQTGQLKNKPGDFLKIRALMETLTALNMNKNKKLALQGLMQKI